MVASGKPLDQSLRAIAEFSESCLPICLEITESHWLDTDGPSRRVLSRLLDRGFLLALDDFGTGYASLVLLRAFPFNHVKVDRSFVQGLGQSQEASALCRAML